MNYIEFFFIAATLSFDTFAVSLAGGLTLAETSCKKKAKIVSSFAFMQAALFIAGWYAASFFAHIITAWDHWIAFSILLLLGIKIISDSIKVSKGGEEHKNIDLLDNRQLLLLSVATSIDAVAVGISMAFIEFAESRIYIDLLILAAVSAIAAFAGLSGAAKIRERFCWKASLAGGIILIFLGVKILVEHIC